MATDRWSDSPGVTSADIKRWRALYVTDTDGRTFAVPAGGAADDDGSGDEPDKPTEEPKPEPDQPSEPHGADEPDWKAEARKWEARAKENKDAASKLKELEDAQKTEQERLTEKLTETETRAKEAELRAARLEVATDKGLPKTSVKFLTGTTKEELEESADELLSLLKPSEEEPSDDRPKPRLNDDTPSDDQSKSPSELAESILSEGRL